MSLTRPGALDHLREREPAAQFRRGGARRDEDQVHVQVAEGPAECLVRSDAEPGALALRRRRRDDPGHEELAPAQLYELQEAARDARLSSSRSPGTLTGSLGGEVAARLDSLVLSCRQNGADPETYVTDVLGRVATTPHLELATLTPLGWADARAEEAPFRVARPALARPRWLLRTTGRQRANASDFHHSRNGRVCGLREIGDLAVERSGLPLDLGTWAAIAAACAAHALMTSQARLLTETRVEAGHFRPACQSAVRWSRATSAPLLFRQ
ncbi:MAG: transposase domain-containing protein [Planctomycetota bacterium]